MDVLNDIFNTLDLKGALYFRTHFSAPWAVTVPELEQAARFHLVVQGACHITVGEDAELMLGPGDLLLIPRGRSHILADQAGRSAAPLEMVLESAGYLGDGVLIVGEGDAAASTQLVCGHLTFRRGADHPILRALPDYLHVSASQRLEQPWLDDILRLLPRRLFAGGSGSEAAVTRLSEIVFIELLRFGVRHSESLQTLLEALAEPKIARALEMMHAHPAESWTVSTLAREIGMSRSRFAARFSALVGTGPMAYLADWRLQKALPLLEDASHSVQQVASQIGYESPAAFTRAFSGKFGLAPREYRRQSI